ncbi:hypothetical protein F2Q68_00038087 [Brassica cretica]|uniref:F-box domain-containing protein n=1 Tax=Brassica cretica TaxID=69181 RepID=A0A8S9H932_BRACR|nr:hypothetical protein F2Q68_00038087 [Brassica cretica]
MHLSSVTSSSGANAEESPKKLHDDNDAPSSLLLLSDEISLNCLARVPRCYYPWVSLVSTTLRRAFSTPPHRTQEIKHRLVPVPLVPYWGMSIVTVGSEMYFLGGSVDDSFVSTAFVIDCPSYTCRSLPNMKQERGCAAAGIVDGKLGLGLNNVVVYEKTIRSFVMDDKICIMDRESSLVYDPKEGVLERDLLLNKQWRGLENLPGVRGVTKMANCGGKIAILCNVEKGSTKIWYTQIGLERREGGEVWGTILWSGLVLASEDFSTIVRSLSVSF